LSNSKIKAVLVAYPDSFRLDEAKNLVESAVQTTTPTTVTVDKTMVAGVKGE
jgi:hypothetical protein